VIQQDLEEAEQRLGEVRHDLVTTRLQCDQARREAEAARTPPPPQPPPPPQAPQLPAPDSLREVMRAAPAIVEETPAGQPASPLEDTALPAEGKKQLGVTVNADAVVVEVAPATPAEKAGLQQGDVVLSVDGKPVATGEDLRTAIEKAEPGQEVSLTVARGPETEEVKAQLPEPPP
jgi:hypothetical protein